MHWLARRPLSRRLSRPLSPALRLAVRALLLGTLGACAGGSGCGSCGTALPGGFPSDQTISNAGTLRITKPGLDFISTNTPGVAAHFLNAPDGIFKVNIPTSTITASKKIAITFTAHITLCPLGPRPKASPPECEVDVNIGALTLKVDAVTPHAIKLVGTIPVRMPYLPIHETTDNAPDLNDFGVGLGQNNGCNGNVPKVDWKTFPITITVPFLSGTTAPRAGYTAIDLANLDIAPGINSNDVDVCKDCSFPFCSDVINFVRDQAFGSILDAVKSSLKGVVASQLCTKAGSAPTPCPKGTELSSDKATCVFPGTQACVPTALGGEGHFELGSLLTSVSPGTEGAFDFVLAAGGDVDPAPGLPADDKGYPGHTPNGLTLHMLGGVLPSPKTSCVPPATIAVPTLIPVPDELRADTVPGWPSGEPGPHVGIALAERFINYALGQTYNSGLLCLGISTAQIAQVQTGLVSALVPSVKYFTFEEQPASVAIATRPQKPPRVVLGGGTDLKSDPLLTLKADEFSIDFYVWSTDRYIRVFTFTADLSVPLNLQTGKTASNPKGGLLPAIGTIALANGTLSNSDLLLEDSASVASALQSIISGLGGQFAGAFSPIDLSSLVASSGLSLTIPTGGIRKLTKGSDNFLAVFGELGTTGVSIPLVGAKATIQAIDIDPSAMALATIRPDHGPVMHASFEPVGAAAEGRDIEFSYALDGAPKSLWSTARTKDIRDPYLVFQGKHTLHAWARVVGEPATESETPYDVPYVVDVLPPMVALEDTKTDGFVLHARDYVTADADLRARARFGFAAKAGEAATPGEFGAWGTVSEVQAAIAENATSGALTVDVEVKDEQGNIGKVSQPLIRGRADSTLAAAGGCSCDTPGGGGAGTPAAFLLVALGAAIAGLRRRGHDKVGA